MSQELLNELISKSEGLNIGEKLQLIRYLSSHLEITGLTQILRQDAICRGRMPFAPTRYGAWCVSPE